MGVSEAATPKKKRSRGAVTVAEILREDILTLALEPGSAVDEVALATRFGLSRTPIREALLILAGERLVSFLQNRTSIVTPHSMHNANDYLDTLSLLTRAVFRQSAERRTEDDLEAFSRNLAALEEAISTRNVDVIEPAELALKRTICHATHNFFYEQYYPTCLDSGRRMLRLHYYPAALDEDYSESFAEYTALQKQLIAGNPEQCDTIAKRILARIVKVLQRSLLPSDAANMELDMSNDRRLLGTQK